MRKPTVVVIGGGIAGVGAAYALANAGCPVTLVEAESSLAYHTTGRSAAIYFENYGAAAIRGLTTASRSFFDAPPAGLIDHPLLERRGALWIGTPAQEASLRSHLVETEMTKHPGRWLGPLQAAAMVPVLRPEYLLGAVLEPEALDLDVAGLHQAFVRGLRAAGGDIRSSTRVDRVERNDNTWSITAGADELAADVIVDAAGAWGDVVAVMAGAPPIGLKPMRRTAFMVPGDLAYRNWPLVGDTDNDFYFRPDGSQVLCSLAEEKVSEPEDARPDELDIALAIDRINTATTLGIRTVRSAWTGLRTFAPDRAMVIGWDPEVAGFFWLVGQGGTGIQTAPAAGRLTADLITTGQVSPELADQGVDVAGLGPGRFT
ncbi:MAG: NAD(P)/FAD-dependent oxidoreductase [Acidimicrobiia bacterium]